MSIFWHRVSRTRLGQFVRYKTGALVANSLLESGSRDDYIAHYDSRVTTCLFLEEESHYEHPRAKWILENLQKDWTVLEVGCGDGGMTKLMSPKVSKIHAIDISRLSIEKLRTLALPNVDTYIGLIEEYSPSETFDAIVLSEVIEHVQDPKLLLEILLNFLKPEGRIFITTPNGLWESDEHLHIWSLESLSTLIAKIDLHSFEIGYLRDRDNKNRWIVATLRKAASAAEPDSFHSRKAVAHARRTKSQ